MGHWAKSSASYKGNPLRGSRAPVNFLESLISSTIICSVVLQIYALKVSAMLCKAVRS